MFINVLFFFFTILKITKQVFIENEKIEVFYTLKNGKRVPYINLYFEEKEEIVGQIIPSILDFNSDNTLLIGKTNNNDGFKCEDEDFCKFDYFPLLEDSYNKKNYFYYQGKTSLKLKPLLTECVTKMDFRYTIFKNFDFEKYSILGFSPNSDFFKYNLSKSNNNNILFIYTLDKNNQIYNDKNNFINFHLKLNQSMDLLKCVGNEINKYPLIENENHNLYLIEGNIKSKLFKKNFPDEKKYNFCIFFDKESLFYFSKKKREDICQRVLKHACYSDCNKEEEINFFVAPDIIVNFNGSKYLIQARHYLIFNTEKSKWECNLEDLEQKNEKYCDFGIGKRFLYLYNPVLGFDDIEKNPYIMFLKFNNDICYKPISRIILYILTGLILFLLILGTMKCVKNYKEKKEKIENDKKYKIYVN